ncbi:MAG: hypothetical protein ACXVYV_08830, partial [Gaiellales bacterium]
MQVVGHGLGPAHVAVEALRHEPAERDAPPALAERDPALRRRAVVVDHELGVGDALAARPADLGQPV